MHSAITFDVSHPTSAQMSSIERVKEPMNRLILLAFVVGALLSGVIATQVCPAEEVNRPIVAPPNEETKRRPVPKEHPRLLGSRERLQRLVRERADAYQRVVRVARQAKSDEHSQMISMALVTAIERDRPLGRTAIDMALKTVDGPIQEGHVPFAHDLARCAIVYDLCYEYWTPNQRERFYEYTNNTVDANVGSEPHVFHNGRFSSVATASPRTSTWTWDTF
jgi:hypothetical protein